MAFRTKLDFSNNRQVKQFEKTQTVLSGGTSFGLTFSALTSGPDPITSGETNNVSFVASTFSGNSATTVYNWYDPAMSLAEPYFSAITPSNSAITQSIDSVFTAQTTTVVDGNTVALSYSGVGFDITPIAMYDLGGGAYSGTVETADLFYYSATTLDYTGRTIWVDVSGITRTERLIVTNEPQVGYVLTCNDSEGMATWSPVSGVTISGGSILWSAGTGTYGIAAKNHNAIASGNNSVAFGLNTIASGTSSHAEGIGCIAGYGSHAEGYYSKAIGVTCHTEGEYTLSLGENSHAEGYQTQSIGGAAHAEGSETIASGNSSHAEGILTIASGAAAHAEGCNTLASGDYSHAGGFNSVASGISSFVHGTGSTASGISTIVLGDDITGSTENTTYVSLLNIKNLSIFSDNTAALLGGLEVGTVYRTSTGQLMIVY